MMDDMHVLALTTAQIALLKKVAGVETYLPYGGEWSTFYRLKELGLLAYANVRTNNAVWVTEAGLAAVKALP